MGTPHISLRNLSVWIHRGLARPARDSVCLAAPRETWWLLGRSRTFPSPVPVRVSHSPVRPCFPEREGSAPLVQVSLCVPGSVHVCVCVQ